MYSGANLSQEVLKELETKHTSASAASAKEIEDLKAAHAIALEEAKAAGSSELQSQHDAALKDLEAKHASTLEEAKATGSKDMSALQAKHDVRPLSLLILCLETKSIRIAFDVPKCV
jgi:hypothetical protein